MFVFAISISGCGNSTQSDSSAAKSLDEISMENLNIYSSAEIFDDIHFIYLSVQYNEGLYIYGSLSDDPNTANVYYCDINEDTISKVDYDTDDTTPLISMDIASNGDLWLVKYNETESDGNIHEGYQIDIVSNGSNDITLFEHEKIDSVPMELVLSEGRDKLYLYTIGDVDDDLNHIYVYNMQGEHMAKIDLNSELHDIVFSEKDNRLYTLDVNNTIGVLNEESNSIDNFMQIESTANTRLFKSSEYCCLIDMDSVLMGVDSKNNALSPIIDWTANGIPDAVRYATPCDERYIVIYREPTSNIDEVSILSKTSKLQSDRKVLKLATMEVDSIITYAVANFNNQSTDYYIEIADYSIYNSDETPNEGMQKLNTEVVSGKPPDIFDMNSLPIDKYIAMGVLEDLNLYMQGTFNLNDYWESAISTLYDDGSCYLVVPSFAITTIFTNSDDVNSLSFLELLSYIRGNADEQINSFGSEWAFLEHIVSCYYDHFIDWDKKTCYFDSDEFVELLAAASNSEGLDKDYDDYIMINKGQQSISSQWIYNIMDIDFLAAVFNDNYSMISASNDKGGCGAKMLPLYSFGMSSISDNKEGAWQFLQYMYSDDAQKIIEHTGISIKKSNLDTQLEEMKEKMKDEEGYGTTGYTYYAANQEDYFIPFIENRLYSYDSVLELINSIDGLYQRDVSILEIIEEDAAACLGGYKSVEEVAAIIQSRASTYINEQS